MRREERASGSGSGRERDDGGTRGQTEKNNRNGNRERGRSEKHIIIIGHGTHKGCISTAKQLHGLLL